MKRLSSFAAAFGVLLALSACGSESKITITGSVLILETSHFERNGSTCIGADMLSAVREGATVTIDDDTTAPLSCGTVTDEGNCRFLFAAEIPDKDSPKRYDFDVEGLPSVIGVVNTSDPIFWQSSDADGWVTIGWD